jgi:hypothetical protein
MCWTHRASPNETVWIVPGFFKSQSVEVFCKLTLAEIGCTLPPKSGSMMTSGPGKPNAISHPADALSNRCSNSLSAPPTHRQSFD